MKGLSAIVHRTNVPLMYLSFPDVCHEHVSIFATVNNVTDTLS